MLVVIVPLMVTGATHMDAHYLLGRTTSTRENSAVHTLSTGWLRTGRYLISRSSCGWLVFLAGFSKKTLKINKTTTNQTNKGKIIYMSIYIYIYIYIEREKGYVPIKTLGLKSQSS